MKTILFGFIAAINLLGLSMMGIDKWKATGNRWRIPEKTLFLISLLGGSIGIFIGMYLFRHKTKKLRFTIGIPVLLVLQILCVLFLFLHRQEQLGSPSTAVDNELALIQNLDETTIQNFVSYENMMSTPPTDSKVGRETTEAVHLFFKNFQYHVHSEEITGDTATVSAKIINIDTHALARDVCLALTARNLNLNSDSQAPETLNDYFTLLRDTLKNNSYELVATTAYFQLTRENNVWTIQSDADLQDQLVSGFISWINDPDLLNPTDVLKIYLDEFTALTGQEWIDYLSIEDIFSTGSALHYSEVDQLYLEKITEYFSYTIESCTTDGNMASAQITITSIDMAKVLECYKEKLLKYAHTSESITSDDASLADDSAAYLMEALEEAAAPATFPVTVTLTNDGHTWQLEISEELTNAFLGDISGAIEAFAS